ncbi:MAG: DNA recombination protein RmuC [Bacilli bacterium]|nr:DNA recombination protein RmuC [Bacilli bacterium]
MIDTILLIILIVLVLACLVFLFLIFKKKNDGQKELDTTKLEKEIKDEISRLKQEIDNKLSNVQKAISSDLNSYLDNFNKSTNEKLDLLTNTLKENVSGVEASVKENTNKIEEYLNSIRETLAKSIEKLQEENSKKLEEMRKTVDEKLESTLNKRLTESFKLVQENLDKVQLGLGEMQTLATGVGDLKKVLTNVKTRGIWGEMQLSQILSQLLTADQYEENVVTRPKSKDPVEFAIRLPGDNDEIVRIPVDSKFPLDGYSNLLDAYDSLDKDQIEKAQTSLKASIKKFAKDIRDKYIEPPFTTDFGIMFLPVEGLYAEVAKSGLIDELQNTYRIIIAGPTTMAALLNSLQVGFRTLAIQKRSSEVWNLLSAVKTEFNTFAEVLKKAQDKIKQADNEIENLVGTRTRQIQKKLKDVTELDYKKAEEITYTEE